MTQPWLGLYCILRDAEKTLPTLLKSIDGIFDEVVFVDTGSSDGTTEIIDRHYGLVPKEWNDPPQRVQVEHRPMILGRPSFDVVRACFEWVDDFAAARQFAFELGTARWRMYLDADDKAEFDHLRRCLGDTEKNSPATNCVSLKYDYLPNEIVQDTIRLVRWADGWKWEDEVHEHMVTVGGRPKVISKYADVWVRHVPVDPHHSTESWERNLRIQEKAYANAKTPEKKALWAYYLATYITEAAAQDSSRYEIARKFWREAGDNLGRNNLACDAFCRWARMEMRLGNHGKAIDLAAEAIGKAPEMPDGLAAMGVAQLLSGATYRAAGVFDLMGAMNSPILETQRDAVWLDGIVNTRVAQAYYRTGRVDDAGKALMRIPESLLKHPDVIDLARQTSTALQKTDGFERLKALFDFLIWDTEPLKAKRLLEEFCPAALSDSPQVKDLLRQIEPKLAHMKDWNAYQRAYASIPDDPYHVPEKDRAWTLLQGRARALQQWAATLPKEGPTLEVLVIGIQDGLIEAAMMEACSRIHLTACDVAPQASRGINELIERFPGRVKTHAVKESHFDWFPSHDNFDAVVLFEVLEHLPDIPKWGRSGDLFALQCIRAHLKSDGKLFLSTPIAASWVEPYLSDLKSPRPWWHVRAHNPTSLWNLFRTCGFTGSLIGLPREELFLAVMTPVPDNVGSTTQSGAEVEVNIYVYPMRPLTQGFDPASIKVEHVGGSEEAVIHLSAALARKGAKVTVYTDMPERQGKTFVHQGVQWRTHAELDVQSLKGNLLVWRAPQMAAHFKKMNPKLKVLNWLHDTHYNATPEQYEGVDGTVVLSKYHAAAVAEGDGYEGPFFYASNGIVPEEFPEPDESKRSPHSAIYASAPNRGLELLLLAWPQIREAVPDAVLDVYYSWVLTEKMLEKRPEPGLSAMLVRLKTQLAALKDHGVTYHGGVDHKTLNEAYRTHGVWSYPPIAFNEISCISALRAQASGCYPVIIPTGALNETCPFGTKINPDIQTHPLGNIVGTFASEVIKAMQEPQGRLLREEMRAWALEQNWDKSADQFLEAIRTKSNRVTIFAGGFGRRFDCAGSADGKPLGGSEEAVIALAKGLAETLDREVVVYAPLPLPGERLSRMTQVKRTDHLDAELVDDDARWIDASKFDPAGPHGTLIAWRCPSLMPRLQGNGYPVILWLMDPEYRAQPCDYAEADQVVFLTEKHKDIIRRKDGYDGGGAVIPVGLPELPPIDPSLLPVRPRREPKTAMWATSPDRGLLEFLQGTWPAVLNQVPDAKLHIFYGLEPLERAGKNELVANIGDAIEALGENVVYHGGVPDAELYEWYQRCSVFAYQCRGFEETQSISLCKALALGCFPVVNREGCLPEVVEACGGLSVPDESYVKTLATWLTGQIEPSVIDGMKTRARNGFSAESMVEKMLAEIEKVQR